MKRIVCLLLISMVLLAGCKKNKTITVSFVEGSSINKYTFPLLTEAYSRIGVELNFRLFPAERSITEVNSGNIDAVSHSSDDTAAKFPELIKLPTPIYKSIIVAVSYGKDLKVDSNNLGQYKVAVCRGIKTTESIVKDHPDVLRLYQYDDLFACIKLNRADLILVPIETAISELNKLNDPKFKILDPPIKSMILYHFLNPNNQAIAKKIGPVLTEMEENGEINKFMQEVDEKEKEE